MKGDLRLPTLLENRFPYGCFYIGFEKRSTTRTPPGDCLS